MLTLADITESPEDDFSTHVQVADFDNLRDKYDEVYLNVPDSWNTRPQSLEWWINNKDTMYAKGALNVTIQNGVEAYYSVNSMILEGDLDKSDVLGFIIEFDQRDNDIIEEHNPQTGYVKLKAEME